jgi:hypothetical protein
VLSGKPRAFQPTGSAGPPGRPSVARRIPFDDASGQLRQQDSWNESHSRKQKPEPADVWETNATAGER